MLKTLKIAAIAAAVSLALPALAGGPARSLGGFVSAGGDAGWQLAQHKYEFANGKLEMSADCDLGRIAPKIVKAPQARSPDGFEPAGGEAGWQLAQHKYNLVDGKLVMSDECDHAIRAVKAPTAEDFEWMRRMYPHG